MDEQIAKEGELSSNVIIVYENPSEVIPNTYICGVDPYEEKSGKTVE